MQGDPKSLRERLAFLNLEPADVEYLAALRPELEKHASGFVAAFYRHLLSFPATRELLRDPAVKERLLAKQREYLLSLAGPTFDEDYVADRRRIGEVHERIGLGPSWYLGSYALYLSLLTPLVCEVHGTDPARAMGTMIALQKVLLFDAQVAMETYIDRGREELEYLAEELAREGRRLARDFRDQTTRLHVTTERARAAEELASIGTLIAGLAHEIGTPMGVIQGHAKLLEPAVSDENAIWRLRTIQEQIGRISNIIQALLNMARPGRARRIPVSLEALLDTTLSFVREKLKRRGIQVERCFEPVPSVQGDAERLQQLFLNLFLNAADAMRDGGTLRVELRPGDDGDVRICVSDTGVGIPPEDAEKIFEPFFTTKAAGQGNGLGLMVAKGIVVDHGGTVDVRSAPGAGTEFCIELPPATGAAPSGAARDE